MKESHFGENRSETMINAHNLFGKREEIQKYIEIIEDGKSSESERKKAELRLYQTTFDLDKIDVTNLSESDGDLRIRLINSLCVYLLKLKGDLPLKEMKYNLLFLRSNYLNSAGLLAHEPEGLKESQEVLERLIEELKKDLGEAFSRRFYYPPDQAFYDLPELKEYRHKLYQDLFSESTPKSLALYQNLAQTPINDLLAESRQGSRNP